MSYYEYRVVPAPKSLPKVKGQKSPEGRYCHAMSEALNAEGRDGWEFQRSETIETAVKRGFLSKARPETISVLVFRRWVEIDANSSRHPFEPAVAPAPHPDQTFDTPAMAEPEPQYEPAFDDAPAEPQSRNAGLFARRGETAQAQVPPLRAPDRD